MARGEIKIPIAADTSGIQKEINNGLIEPLEDAEKALKALEKVDAGKDLERDLKKAGDASEDLKDELDDARDQLKKLGFAAKDAGDDAKRGMDRAGEGVEEFRDEANSTAREAAASFDGSAESIADAFQEVAANAFAGFGPAGAIAGLALAAGLGIFMQKINEATEAVEELQERANDIHLAALEKGVSVEEYVTGLDYITEALERLNEEGQKKFRWAWEEDKTGLQELTDDLKTMGETQADVSDIMSLSTDAMEDYRDAVKKSSEDLRDQADAIEDAEKGMGTLSDADLLRINSLRDQADAGDRVVESLEREIETREEAGERSTAWADSGAADAQKRADAEEEMADRIQGAMEAVTDSVDSAYASMVQDATEFATAENGALDINRWLSYVQEHAGAVASYQANLQLLKMAPGDWDALMSMPEESRAQWVAQVAALPEEARAPFIDALDGIAGNAGSGAAVSFDDSFNPEAEVEVDVEVDTGPANDALDDVSKKRTAEIAVKTTGKADAKSALDNLAKKRYATIDVRADVSDFNASVNSARRNQEARPVYITIRAKNGGAQLV